MHYKRSLAKGLLLACLLGCTSTYNANAQGGVGIKIAQFRPGGDLRGTYKKSLAYEGYFTYDFNDEKMRAKAGFFYAKAGPLLDTFRSYGTVGSGSSLQVLPGYETFKPMRMTGFYIDQSRRIVKVKQFSLFAGLGLMISSVRRDNSSAIEGMYSAAGAKVQEMGFGLRMHLSASYKPTEKIYVTAEYMHNAMAEEQWNASFAHNTIGISVNYLFISDIIRR